MRPTFNVTNFQKVTNVQMNDGMRHLLIRFIDEVDNSDLEVELRALRNALSDPQGTNFKRSKKQNGSKRRLPQRI